MTTPADIAGAITRRVEKHLHDVQGCWPHAFPVRLGTQRELEADPVGTFDADNAVRAWAERHGCRIETVRRRVGTPVDLVARVVVPDEATALRAAGREVRARRELAVARMRMVCSRFGVDEAQAMAIVKMLSGESDVDFELFVHAAQWFATHRDLIAGMTAREVPLPGFSAKWLKASRSVRRRAICTLLGWSELPLRERPGELRYRYLDEACTAWPERLATEPVQAPEMPVDTVLVVENKDTYQAIPSMPRALCVFGSGAAVSRLRTLLPWCVNGGVKKVYNSAAICFPDGHTESYQKMHRAGSEETVWSVPGNTPVMFEMPEWTGKDGSALKAGVNICRDGHFYPELGRYYAASGAELLIHPTATGGNPWYRETRIGSYTDRDGMAAVTANLWGQDGYPIDSDGKPIYSVDANGETVSSGKDVAGYNYSGVGRDSFRSTSLIINAWGRKNGTSFDYATGSALDTSGTGNGATADVTKDWYFGQGGFDPDNLETRTMDLSRAGFRITNFQPRLYSQMYDAIAQRTVPGYSAMYSTGSPLDTSALDEPTAKADAAIASPSAYTTESVEPVQEALFDARSLLGNTTFSAEQQPLVEAAAAELNTALAGLEKAAPTPADPAEPNQPATPADPVDTPAGTPTDPQSPSEPADGTVDAPATVAGAPAVGTLSSTGSQIALVAALALMGVAGGSVLIVAKRKAHVE